MTFTSRALCLFNRVVVALLSLSGLAVAVELIVAPEGAASILSSEVAILHTLPMASLTFAGAVLGAMSVLVLLLEISVGRERRMFQARVDGGTVEYPAAMIASTIERELQGVSGVEDSRITVLGRHQRVDLQVRLTTDPDDDAQAIATQASNRIHDRVESLGLEVSRLRLVVDPSSRRKPTSEPRHSVAV
jgi:hypothetical protein